MKKFWNMSKIPLLIAVIASVLFIVDALIGCHIKEGASFMWVAFVIWILFFGASLKDRVRAFIGVIVGFLAGVLMMLITSSFTLNLYTISLSSLIGVFVVNLAVMYLDIKKNIWINSISGIFAGIALTFSGLGVGFNPLASVSEAFIMLGVILLYTLFGLVCGFLCVFFTDKIKNKRQKVNVKNNEGNSDKTENTEK